MWQSLLAQTSKAAQIMDISYKTLHVWLMNWKNFEGNISLPNAYLSQAELQESNRYRFFEDCLRFRFARSFLKAVLGSYLGIDPYDVRFNRDSYGKPYISSLINPQLLSFNLSHSNDFVACVVCKQKRVGVDIEFMRKGFNYLNLAKNAFAPEEFQELVKCSPQLSIRRFFMLWTCKEAFVKALGVGLSARLDSFVMTVKDGASAQLVSVDPTLNVGEVCNWTIDNFLITPDYAGTVVVEGSDIRAVYYTQEQLTGFLEK